MRNERARPQQCWKSCANGSNIVALRFGDHRTKEMLGVVGWKVWPVSNFAQPHPTTCNKVCKRTQHVTSNNVGSCLPTILRPFARGLMEKNMNKQKAWSMNDRWLNTTQEVKVEEDFDDALDGVFPSMIKLVYITSNTPFHLQDEHYRKVKKIVDTR